MSLYQTSVLNKYLNLENKELVAKAFKKFSKYFLDPTIQNNIRNSKEEEYQGIFLTELFVKILGYTLKPNAKFNLVAEYKNEKNSRKADGAILKDNEALGVIELKGTNTKDLEKVRQQAFDYKANQTGCIYVITSNFEKIRFYINNAVDYEEFDLFNLSEERFRLLYLCLAKENLLEKIPLKIKEASVQEEESITKEFYKDYSTFKRELFRDLVKLNLFNKVFRAELDNEDNESRNKKIKQSLFKKSQKLIDRFLFIFFAEDRGLIPPNSTVETLEQWDKLKELDEEVPLYNRYKKYFNYLDQGRKGTSKTAEIFAYNGGLFKPDPVLDSLLISDELLYKHTKKLQAYDFESQVDVNILGHIFENSLNEIESVNAEIEGGEFDKQKSKRKKDGVFYTPKYITKYIVDNTVGKLCNEKKTELGVLESEYLKGRKGRAKNKLKELLEKLEVYRTWLLKITILDPACGSGAFLNQALDFLIKEHGYIDELQTNLLGGGFVFPDIENTILENNIFGVDLNEESVEIAKLSLWLRTAQPRRKLNDLSSNIKCGNSLIDNKAIAGAKAFKWETEYPQVFENDGFDVIIGNPPYVRQELFKEIKPYLEKNYKCYNSIADLYVYFFEKSIGDLLKDDGLYSIIVANKWMRSNYGKELRVWLKDKNIVEIIDFKDLPVFADATAYPCIITIGGRENNEIFSGLEVDNLSFSSLEQYVSKNKQNVNRSFLRAEGWSLSDEKVMRIINEILKKNIELKDFIAGKMFVGLKTGLNDAFIISKMKYELFIADSKKYKELLKPYGVGRDLSRYGVPVIDKYVIVIPSKWTNSKGVFQNENLAWEYLEKEFPLVAAYLKPFEDRARKRTDKGNYWWELRACDYYSEFEKAKIVYPEIATEGRFSIDTAKSYFDMTSFIIGSNSFELLGILNSKLINFIFNQISSEIRGGFLRWKRQYVNKLPIPKNINNENLNYSVSLAIESKRKFDVFYLKFIYYLRHQIQVEKVP